jgi:cytoskeletal protein CcmA (bactofilin family)
MRALVDRKVTNRITYMNNRLAEFAVPIMRNNDLYVYRNFVVSGNEEIKGNSTINGNLLVKGDGEIEGNLLVKGDEEVEGELVVFQDVSMNSRLFVNGDVSMNSRLFVVSDVSFGARLFVNELNVRGNINADGYILAKTFLPGQIINLSILGNTQVPYKPSDINPQFKVVNTVGAAEQLVFQYTYTPLSSYSNIIIDFNSVYSVEGGLSDSYTGYLYVNNLLVGRSYQQWNDSNGGGTRSGTLLPISGRYTNSASTSFIISLRIVNSGDDILYIDSDLSTWLKITEVGR